MCGGMGWRRFLAIVTTCSRLRPLALWPSPVSIFLCSCSLRWPGCTAKICSILVKVREGEGMEEGEGGEGGRGGRREEGVGGKEEEGEGGGKGGRGGEGGRGDQESVVEALLVILM